MAGPRRTRSDRASQLDLKLSGKPTRRADRPEPDEERLVWLLLTLVRRRRVAFAEWFGKYGRSERTFDRDIGKLRDLGERHAFRLVRQADGAIVLRSIADVAEPGRKADELASDALNALVDALGDVIGNSLRNYIDFSGGPFDRFLRFATPRLRPSSDVAEIYARLREAWTKRAAVRFQYPRKDGVGSDERIVQPYLVSYNSGRYYLVAFDTRGRTGGWRQYALDRIGGRIAYANTFVPKSIPAAYAGEDAIGLFKRGIGDTNAPSVAVTIELSDVIATSVVARSWQREQSVEVRDGRTFVSFVVHDVAEAVRWAFGFGLEARIVAPPSAVALARDMAAAVLAAYAPGTSESSVLA